MVFFDSSQESPLDADLPLAYKHAALAPLEGAGAIVGAMLGFRARPQQHKQQETSAPA
jgi:hypothetical protein